MTTIHIMLDLETWGTAPGCDIRSIGACVFDPVAGWNGGIATEPVSTFYVACDNPTPIGYVPTYEQEWEHPRKYLLTREPRTAQWWNEQSPEAQAAFADPVDLRDCLERFTQWLCNVTGKLPFDKNGKWIGINCALWSHGAAFDPPILAAAYAAVGLPVPWHYRAPRDTRTAFDMAGISDHSAWLTQHCTGTHHHALDDASAQARAVCAAYARLRVPNDVLTHRDAWRGAIGTAIMFEKPHVGYYEHELKVFNRVFDMLVNHPMVDQSDACTR